MPESSRQPELAASTSIRSIEVQGPRTDRGPLREPEASSSLVVRSIQTHPIGVGFLFPESCRGAPYKAPLCKGAGRRQAAWGIVFPKPLDSGGSPRMGSVIPRREKKFRARRAGFPPRAGTRDSPAGDVISATGEDESLRPRAAGRGAHTPCGGRSAPPSLWGGEAATALLRRAASAASDAGSSCVGRPESIQSKGVPAAPRAVGSKEMVPPGGTREKSPGPGSSFACLKPKCAPAPHRAHGMRPHPA